MQRRLILLLLMATHLWIGGCVWLPGSDANQLSNMPPLLLSEVGAPFQASGQLSFQQGNQTLTFPLELLLGRERMSVVLFSPIGGALSSATFTGDRIDTTGAQALPLPLQGNSLLRALQWALWPSTSVRQALAQQGLHLHEQESEQEGGQGLLREIRDASRALVQIHTAYPDPLQGAVEFRHLTERYQWTLRIVRKESLENPAP